MHWILNESSLSCPSGFGCWILGVKVPPSPRRHLAVSDPLLPVVFLRLF